jgi:uncharacterized protein (TIRG00374 family)
VITPNIASAAEHVRREQRVLRLIGHRRECALRRRSSSVVSNQTAPYLLVLSSAWALIGVRSQWRTNAAEPVVMLAEEAEPGDTARSPIASAGWLRWARWIACAVLLAVAITTIVSEWGTLRSGLVRLGDLRWGDLRWAIYAERLAMIAFAQLTRLLLRAGGVKLGLGSMIGLTLASNAVALTLPGGPAWAVTFSYSQLRRRGVRRALTAYALTLTWLMSAVALVAIALVGVDLAGKSGPAAPFRVIAIVCTIAFALPAVAVIATVRLPRCRTALAGQVDRLCASNRWRRIGQLVRASEQELSRVRLPPRMLVRCISLAILNWIYDCGCLVFSLLAVGGHVPWQGILVTYGVTQLAAALPITPGGIGVVEGTLSVLLIAYHVPAATAIAGVMLYRMISFWVSGSDWLGRNRYLARDATPRPRPGDLDPRAPRASGP